MWGSGGQQGTNSHLNMAVRCQGSLAVVPAAGATLILGHLAMKPSEREEGQWYATCLVKACQTGSMAVGATCLKKICRNIIKVVASHMPEEDLPGRKWGGGVPYA